VPAWSYWWWVSEQRNFVRRRRQYWRHKFSGQANTGGSARAGERVVPVERMAQQVPQEVTVPKRALMRASLPMSMRMYRCFPNARRALFSLPCLLHRTWRTVFGQVDRRSANRHRSDPEFASCVSSTHGSLQYSFTLALEDGAQQG